MGMSKKKESRQARNQKKVEKERAREGRTASLVKQTRSSAVTRTNLKDKNPSDETQEHLSPESVRKIVPITDKTEKTLQQWAGNVGKVGVTSIVPLQKRLITVVFGYDNRSGTLISYNTLEEEVYGLTPHNKGYEPKEGERCFCEKPRLDLEPLFFAKDRPVYTTIVYPLITELVNENIELFISHDSEIAIPNWIMIEETKKMATILVEDGKCSAIRIRYSSLMAKAVVRKLNSAEEEKMGTMRKDNMWKLVEGVIERPLIFSALDQQEIVDIVSEVIYAFESDQQIEVRAV